MIVITTATALSACDRISAKQSVPPTESGRYVVTYSPNVARDTFLVDTGTGRVWQLVEDKDHNESWQAMSRSDEFGFPQ
jgi:hypothetical protein